MHHRYLLASGMVLLGVSVTPAFSAKPIDLSHQPASVLQTLTGQMKQIGSETDFNKTNHIRVQQTYKGYPVWGADAVVHVPQGGSFSTGTMNGVIYDGLNADLANAPAYIFTKAQSDKVLQQAVQTFEKKSGVKNDITESHAKLMVFIDKNDKAHWAFLVDFYANAGKASAAKPMFIMDAVTLEIYQQWNNLQTMENVEGGGFGGNEKEGKFVYDGLKGDLPKLTIQRDAQAEMCYTRSDDVIVKDVRSSYQVYKFKCAAPNEEHDKVFWNGDSDKVNGGYSASDDAMFAGMVIKNMYEDWYGEVPLKDTSGKPMILSMCVHMVNYDNAYWDGKQMVFGDGASMFYPLVSIGVAAHEISHGFTEQHSHLAYYNQSGGMNEAFSDMAAQAAEYYAYGHNSWEIGPEIFKAKDEALRYMDEPTKDCKGGKPGDWCSISNAKDYNDSIDVHYSSGVFNKLFYLMGTTKGWNTRMAFNVMVQANEHYWTSNSTFVQGACGILKATQDYNKIDRRYDVAAVKKAIDGVGVDTSKCG